MTTSSANGTELFSVRDYPRWGTLARLPGIGLPAAHQNLNSNSCLLPEKLLLSLLGLTPSRTISWVGANPLLQPGWYD